MWRVKDSSGVFAYLKVCTIVPIMGTYSALVMKSLSLNATFATVIPSVMQECLEGSKGSNPDWSYSYGLLSKSLFHARLDTSVTGQGTGFYCLSIRLHMEHVHIVKRNLEMKCLPYRTLRLVWSLPAVELKIPCMYLIKKPSRSCLCQVLLSFFFISTACSIVSGH